MNNKLYRSKENPVVAGVCAGIGNYCRVDPIIVRLGLIFIGIVTAVLPLMFLYLVAWMVMPVMPSDYPVEVFRTIHRSREDRKIAGVCGGFAEFMGWDATAFRLIVVVLGVLTAVFPLVMTYLVAWMIVPEAS